MKGRYHDDGFMHFVVGVFFTAILFVFILPVGNILSQESATYDSVRGFVDGCELNATEVGWLREEVSELKETNWYVESQRLSSEVKGFEDSYFMWFIIWLISWFMFTLLMVYVINRYQTNKIKELEEEILGLNHTIETLERFIDKQKKKKGRN